MNTNVVLIDEHRIELHDAFLSFVPRVFPSISFRRWYELNGWAAEYRAFAIMDGDQIIANVSVQRTELIIDGRPRVGWQLGAVGVLAEHRGRGLQRTLLQHVLDQLEHDDVVFLFANEDVLDFYPLFGFRRVTEWLYGAEHLVEPAVGNLRRMSIDSAKDRGLLARLAATTVPVTQRFGARNYGDVLLWYWSNYHRDDFYYHEFDDAIVVAEQDMEVLRVLDVLAAKTIDLESYLPQLVTERVDHVEFGFTPERIWPRAEPLFEYPESPLFVLGDVELPKAAFKFPVLSQT